MGRTIKIHCGTGLYQKITGESLFGEQSRIPDKPHVEKLYFKIEEKTFIKSGTPEIIDKIRNVLYNDEMSILKIRTLQNIIEEYDKRNK